MTWFEGDITDHDRLIYVNDVLKGKLLESDMLAQQAANNAKEQFSNSPDLGQGNPRRYHGRLRSALDLSKQALDSERVRAGLKDVLLGPVGLYEALRQRREPGNDPPARRERKYGLWLRPKRRFKNW